MSIQINDIKPQGFFEDVFRFRFVNNATNITYGTFQIETSNKEEAISIIQRLLRKNKWFIVFADFGIIYKTEKRIFKNNGWQIGKCYAEKNDRELKGYVVFVATTPDLNLCDFMF